MTDKKGWLGPYPLNSRHADKVTIDEIVRLRAENERLRKALFVIWGWYPTSISNPHGQIKKMRDVADLALNDGDFRQYIKNHYAALEEGE